MASNIIVLMPNGRRQTIKVTPNSTILQILEEACQKHGIQPDQYDIKHHKKVLDPTTTIRFSGLPNNAFLELIEATVVRTESDCILGVQLEDGQRLMGNFTPSTNLWSVLEKLCPLELSDGKSPVVIYMRNEIVGEDALKKTTLKALGITGGRAMLRLINRSPDVLKTQANVSAPLPVKPVEEKPYKRQYQKIDDPEPTVPITKPELPENKENLPFDEPIMKKQPLKKENVDLLDVIKKEKHKQTDGVKTKNVSANHYATEQAPTQDFNEDEIIFLGARNAMLFSLESSEAVRNDDLPDDFFELSIADVKKLFKDIKKRRLESDCEVLMTSAMRELEKSKRELRQLNHYKKTVIRIEFPNRVVLQGTFLPCEQVGDVHEFVREYIEDKTLKFYLFVTPPKEVLSQNARLIDVNCVPGALLHFGCDDKKENYLKSDLLSHFTSTTAAKCAAHKIRKDNTREQQMESDDDDLNNLLSSQQDINCGASTSQEPTTSYEDYKKLSPAATPPEKVPKWYKPTK